MIDRSRLKLIKGSQNGVSAGPKLNREPQHSLPVVTPAEAAEMARFKAFTAARAARQVQIRQIMSDLEGVNGKPPAA